MKEETSKSNIQTFLFNRKLVSARALHMRGTYVNLKLHFDCYFLFIVMIDVLFNLLIYLITKKKY